MARAAASAPMAELAGVAGLAERDRAINGLWKPRGKDGVPASKQTKGVGGGGQSEKAPAISNGE